MTNTHETKDKFYEDFANVISIVPAADNLIILVNYNAKVGQKCASWEGVLGKYGAGKYNSKIQQPIASSDLRQT